MPNENNCHCAVCNVEAALLGSFSTQTARIHFHALANNYGLNQFESPFDLIAHLHDQSDSANHHSGTQILHRLLHAISDGVFEELGQQLLVVAFTPAIHKIFREICQRFPMLALDDIGQQAWVAFIEVAKSPALSRQNGQLPVSLAMNCRKAMLRWAIRESRRASIVQDPLPEFSEPSADGDMEQAILLDDFLAQARRNGLLSEDEYELLIKLKYQGFEAKEVAEATGITSAMHRRLHRRVQTILNRLQREAEIQALAIKNTHPTEPDMNLSPQKKYFSVAVNSSWNVPFSNSEKGFSPELSHSVPHIATDAAQAVA
jgi:DNA-directed RNA polymerase specialized sigma24 family protein